MDSRSIKTQARIEQSFVELLKQKSIHEITITELTSKAKLNRRTFYAHYQDLTDLQNKTEQHVLEQFSQMIDNANNVDYFNKILDYVFDNSGTLGTLCRNRESTLMKNLLQVTINRGKEVLSFKDPDEAEYILNYVCWGLVGIFHKLIFSNEGFTGKNSEVLTDLISTSINPYLKEE